MKTLKDKNALDLAYELIEHENFYGSLKDYRERLEGFIQYSRKACDALTLYGPKYADINIIFSVLDHLEALKSDLYDAQYKDGDFRNWNPDDQTT